MRLLNHLQIKIFIRKNKLKVGKHILSTLEHKLMEILNKSIERARRNRRKTLLGRDL
ncbi:hypothetical protein ACFLZN_01380 [Nanoarchaeota archaeon]